MLSARPIPLLSESVREFPSAIKLAYCHAIKLYACDSGMTMEYQEDSVVRMLEFVFLWAVYLQFGLCAVKHEAIPSKYIDQLLMRA